MTNTLLYGDKAPDGEIGLNSGNTILSITAMCSRPVAFTPDGQRQQHQREPRL